MNIEKQLFPAQNMPPLQANSFLKDIADLQQ